MVTTVTDCTVVELPWSRTARLVWTPGVLGPEMPCQLQGKRIPKTKVKTLLTPVSTIGAEFSEAHASGRCTAWGAGGYAEGDEVNSRATRCCGGGCLKVLPGCSTGVEEPVEGLRNRKKASWWSQQQLVLNMTLIVELLPISAILSILIQQVLETALAAQDVLIEKESFKIMAKYLQDVQPVLSEMRSRDLQDSQGARQALDSLQEDLRRAKALINKCNTKPRFYLLVNCRRIVKEVQVATRNIGKSLQLLAVANAEVAGDIKHNVERLQHEMMAAQFQTSASGQRVLDKLDVGLQEHKTDQGFANDLLREIAMAVGVPVSDESEISKELASFKREKEEAAERKEREEEAFMEQVIALLERSDAAKVPEVARSRYQERKHAMGNSLRESDDGIPALQSFICPLKQDVMEDPVTVANGQTYEREQIQRWFDAGHTTDPLSNQELPNTLLRPNGPLKKSIEEWRERNYCYSIRNARTALQSGNESQQLMALDSLRQLCRDDSRTRDWIVSEGLMVDIVTSLKSPGRDVKKGCLATLSALIQDHDENKDNLTQSGGVEVIVRLLARDSSVSKLAVGVLLELLRCKNGVNQKVHTRIGHEKSAILLLVTSLSTNDDETVQTAAQILGTLSSRDDYVIQMAQANWYNPLVDRLRQGPEESKLVMIKALSQMALTDQSMRTLGQEGIVPILGDMLLSKKFKKEALATLRNLSTGADIKAEVANSSVIPRVLEYLFFESSTHMMELAAEILSNLCALNGTSMLIQAGIEPRPVIERLLEVQRNSLPVTRIHILHALLGLVSTPEGQALVIESRGIPALLPLMDHKDRQVQDCVIQFLYKLSDSEEGSKQLLEQIVEKKMCNSLVRFLQGSSRSDQQSMQTVQVAAAGILAGLPAENDKLASALEAAGALPALLTLLQNANQKSKENAVGALLLFVQPLNLDMQHRVANLDVIPILVDSLMVGSSLTKVRAAQVLGKLSESTVQLNVHSENRSWPWSCFRGGTADVCRVHQGSCDVKLTFCLVEADAVKGLIGLLKDAGKEAEAGLDALYTLVEHDQIVEKGVKMLDELGAIDPVVELLVRGTLKCKMKAMDLLGRAFTSSKMQEKYTGKAQIHLAALAGDPEIKIRKKAAKVLAKLNVIQPQSSYF